MNKNKIFSSDAICVKFINSTLIIYGKGNQLYLRSKSKEIINKIRSYDKIHKISILKHDDIQTTTVACAAGREILITNIVNNEFQGGFITKFNDWISSIKILSNGCVAAVTAHNFAILLECLDEKLVIKEKRRCDDNSTLYCSHIHGDFWDDLTFFAGTALGELIIWKNIEKKPTTLYQKSLHNGVIFSIDYNHNFLVTSSDDRSIKIYNTDEKWKLTESKQLFGHTARVFACKVIKYVDNFLFLSAGEDSNLCIWRSEDGKLLAKMNVDASGGIWSVDYDEKNAIVLTSSSKGKLNRFRLRQILLIESVNDDFTASCCDKIEPAKLKFLSNGILCVLDYTMKIFTHSPITNEWKKVRQLSAERQNVIAIEAWENRLFFMTRNSILIFDYDTASDGSLQFTSELVIDHEKFPLQFDYFRAIHALNFHQVFISDASGACIVVDLTRQKLMKAFKIPKSAEPWSTSVAFIDQYCLIADRMGSLFLYRDSFDGSIYQHPIQKLPKLHAQKMGVKTIRSLANGFVKTTGNDGTMKTLFLNKEKEKLEIYQCEKSAVKWIERVESFNGIEYILGFNDNYFVISKSSEIIYEHACGGRHRHWDIHFPSIKHVDGNYKMRLTYIKRKQVNCVEFFLNDFTFPAPEDEDFTWHTRVCNVVRMIDDDVKILASGGEDTTIKLFKVEMMNDDDASLKRIAEINSHISSVKAMTMWKCEKSGDIWIISAGGRAQIIVTRVIGMTHVKEEVNFMLTNSLALGNAKQSTFDPETRFTSLHFDHASEFLFVGCSDGFLRAFKLSLKSDSSTSLRLMIESHYGKCILQVYALHKSFVLTMASDGVVCFWHFDEGAQSIKLIDKLHHNQNGINSFDVYQSDDNAIRNRYKLATAGDDCGIFITEFEIVANAIKFSKKTIHSYAAHIAQVNGVKFLSSNELITASIDQTLCKLQLIDDDDKIEVVDRRFTCVADVKGFTFYDNNKSIFIYGAGLEMMKSF